MDGTADLTTLRRDLHRHPELAWREFYTTTRIVRELRAIGVDELHVGPDALGGERRRLPDDEELEAAMAAARETDADEAVLDRLEGGYTGVVAVLERGPGPTVGVRVDIDGLPRSEATDDDHTPVAEGFRSERRERMHACGHDAHAAIGVGVVDRIARSDFAGTLKLFFQPSEELGVGAASMVESGHLDDVERFFAVHVGLGEPVGTVVPGIDTFLAVNTLRATFDGEPAHSGGEPHEGRNAVQAAAAAIQNLYAIPRHGDGATRVNVGEMGGGSATNIVPEEAYIACEVRGETTELMRYVESKTDRVIRNAAEMHDCGVDVERGEGLPSADPDAELAEVVRRAAERNGYEPTDVDEALGSEDATRMMDHVQRRGGTATYLGVGGGNDYGHHTARFDVDEAVIEIGVDVISDAVLDVSRTATADAEESDGSVQ